mmetsp:Transcript_39638/g.64507  ORF Transcript_39638/g.64507 Transcript_39638/m.64507 type:complete len:104 (-) Transcript_39638:174-485(-)
MWKGEKALIIATATFPCLVDVVQVATGGTLSAGIELVKKLGGVVVECSCIVELKFLNARKKLDGLGHKDVPIWALMDESILTLDGLKSKDIDTTDYKDDGEAH